MLNRIVNPDGSPNAKIAFVGEAPGDTELYKGKGFVGPAGEELWTACASVGVTRSDCYITNVVKEKPFRNDISTFIKITKGKVVYESPAFLEYKKQLFIELSQITCNVIVPLGNIALYALTGLMQITKRRGSIYEVDICGKKRKVIPSVHPASILGTPGTRRGGNPKHRLYLRMDLRKIVKQCAFPDVRYSPMSILTEPSFIDIVEHLKYAKAYTKSVEYDLEVVNEEVSCFSISYYKAGMLTSMSIPLVKDGSDYLSPEQEIEVWELTASVLEDPSIEKTGQNFTFDVGFTFRKYGIRTTNTNCTMIAAAILFPDFPKGLDFIGTMYTDIPYYKDDGKKYFKIAGDIRKFWEYNAKDSIVCSIAFPKQQAELVRQGNLETYRRQSKMIEPCVYMQERGMRMNVEGLKIASAEAQKKIDGLKEELNQIVGYELNPNSYPQLIEYFYIKKRIKPYLNGEGGMTTDEDAMRRLARQGIKEAQIVRDVRRWVKLKGTYLDVKLSADGRLRSAITPDTTKTGRLNSGVDIFGEGTNVQNIPEGVRQYILTDEGYVTYVCDLSQAENRIVANIAPEPLMLDIFAKGKDMHSITGVYLAKVVRGLTLTVEEVKEQDSNNIKCPLGSGEYTWRFYGKKSNHSFDYDYGYKKFALKYDLTEAEAKPIHEGWYQLYGGIRQYYSWIQAKLQVSRTLTNLFGRKRLFLGPMNSETFRQAYAQIPQSTVADKIDEQGVEYLYYEEPELFRPVDLLNQIHDSVIFQLPLSIPWQHHAEILLALKKSLESPLDWHGNTFIIPLDIKMHIHNLSKKDGKEVKIDGSDPGRLAAQLSEIYRQYGSTQQVSSVEWDISDIGVLEEEGSDALGDGYSLS